jgi:coenzyme F420-reducing hydrogenase delta subunit
MVDKPIQINIFYCSHHLEARHFKRCGPGPESVALKAISLPCSGKVDLPYLIKAFETGADGVALVTCKQHECRHIEGNLRARKRAEGVAGLLREIGWQAERMGVFECAEQGAERVIGEIQQFMEKVRGLSAPGARGEANNLQETSVA